MKKLLCITLFVLGVSACHHESAQLKSREIASGNAGVYIYRVPSSLGANASHEIFLDGRKLGRVRQGTFLRTALAPGKHVIQLRDLDYKNKRANKKHQFSVQPGEKHYVQIMWTPTGKQKRVSSHGFVDWLPHYGAKLTEAKPGAAKQAIRGLKVT